MIRFVLVRSCVCTTLTLTVRMKNAEQDVGHWVFFIEMIEDAFAASWAAYTCRMPAPGAVQCR